MAEYTTLRPPQVEDSPAIYRLIRSCKPLDVNSEYLYMLLCSHFSDTCVTAFLDDEMVGIATAYVIPERPDTLFVWQIAVAKKVRGSGLAKAMLRHVLKRRSCRLIEYVEATATPSNLASMRLFHALARDLETEIKSAMFFSKALFSDTAHEEENLIRVGPIINRGRLS